MEPRSSSLELSAKSPSEGPDGDGWFCVSRVNYDIVDAPEAERRPDGFFARAAWRVTSSSASGMDVRIVGLFITGGSAFEVPGLWLITAGLRAVDYGRFRGEETGDEL